MKRIIYAICLMLLINGCTLDDHVKSIAQSSDRIVNEWRKERDERDKRLNIKTQHERRQHELKIGMTGEEVYEKWGNPSGARKYTTAFGISNIWEYGEDCQDYFNIYYPPDTTLHFLNGKLESIFEHR